MNEESGMTKARADEDLPAALQILRISRGWTQEDLAKASGLHSGTISDYERGKMAPGQKTLQKLLTVLGYSLASLEDALSFVRRRRGESLGRLEEPGTEVWQAVADPDLAREIDEVAFEAGRAVFRLVRLLAILLHRDTGISPERHAGPSEKGEGLEREKEAA